MVNVAERAFLDTNIWLYAFIASGEMQKNRLAKEVIQYCEPVLSTQVINETCVNLLKKADMPENQLRALVQAFYEKYIVVNVEQCTLLLASELREQYSLSYWDSVIVASAVESGCEILYTEDMQAGLRIVDCLSIVNPFDV